MAEPAIALRSSTVKKKYQPYFVTILYGLIQIFDGGVIFIQIYMEDSGRIRYFYEFIKRRYLCGEIMKTLADGTPANLNRYFIIGIVRQNRAKMQVYTHIASFCNWYAEVRVI